MGDTCSANDSPPGHLQSPFFKLMPTELRLEIYRHTFAGSHISLQLHPDWINFQYAHCGLRDSQPRPLLPVGGRRSAFCSSGRYLKHPLWKLLLTCKQVLNEALDIYWSETTVCTYDDSISRGLFFERIPDFAKLHIRHLRWVHTGVNPGVKALRGIAFSRNASFAEALDMFPKLQSCSIRDKSLAVKPSKAVEEALVRHPTVHFLKVYEATEKYQKWCDFEWRDFYERTYVDFTTGMKHTIVREWYELAPDEDEFRRMMGLQPSEKAGANGEAWAIRGIGVQLPNGGLAQLGEVGHSEVLE